MTGYEKKISLLLQCLLWVIPINIYVLGDWWGSGIQWAVFRYQQAFYNNENVISLILYNQEIQWILSGIITGKTILSVIIWGIGIVLLCTATLLIIYAIFKENEQHFRWGALLNIAGACAFTAAILNLYGITFHGPAGIAIPFGIPVILGVAYYQYKIAAKEITAMDDEADCWDEEDDENDLKEDELMSR